MYLLAPVSGTARGWHAFLRGLTWLKVHPRFFILLLIPMALGVALLFTSWGFFYQYSDGFFEWVMFAKPLTWWGAALYYVVKALLFAVIMLMSLVFYALFVSVLASPIYDYVSVAVEKDITGKADELSFWDSLKLIGEELKKFLFIFSLSIGILLIPGLNILAPLVTALCVGWDLYDYPFARRGWSFRQRTHFMMTNFWSVLGLGLWLLIPGVQMLLMPLAVVGGTILAVEDLQRSTFNRKESVHGQGKA